MISRAEQLEAAVRKFAKEAEHDMNGTVGKGGNGGLMSDTTLRACHEVQAILNRSRHPDDIAVDHFAEAMKEKLSRKRGEGRGGWQDKNQCTQQELSLALVNHMRKGDPVDVANFAMMLHQRGETIALPPMSINIDLSGADKARLIEKLQAGTHHLEFLASNPVAVQLIEEIPDCANPYKDPLQSKPAGELCDVCSEIAKIDARMGEINKILDEPRAEWMRPLEDEFTFHRGQLQVLKSLAPQTEGSTQDLPWSDKDIRRGLILFRTSNNAHGYTNVSILSEKVDALPQIAKNELAAMMKNLSSELSPAKGQVGEWTSGETLTPEEAWTILCETPDITSPEGYPDHALITLEQLRGFMERSV